MFGSRLSSQLSSSVTAAPVEVSTWRRSARSECVDFETCAALKQNRGAFYSGMLAISRLITRKMRGNEGTEVPSSGVRFGTASGPLNQIVASGSVRLDFLFLQFETEKLAPALSVLESSSALRSDPACPDSKF